MAHNGRIFLISSVTSIFMNYLFRFNTFAPTVSPIPTKDLTEREISETLANPPEFGRYVAASRFDAEVDDDLLKFKG